MADIVLKSEKREAVGKNKVNKLRQQAIVPGVVYGKDKENINVQFTSRDFEKVLSQAGTTTIINLDLDGEKLPVLIKDYQMHPFKSQFFHVDFQAINAKEAIRVTVPVYLNGRDDIRVEPSVLVQNIDSVDVECLPMYIPQYAEIVGEDAKLSFADIDKLKVGMRCGVTWYDSASKAGCENEMLVWVELKEGSKLVLPSFATLINLEEEKETGKYVYDFEALTNKLEDIKSSVESVEVYYNKQTCSLKNLTEEVKQYDI